VLGDDILTVTHDEILDAVRKRLQGTEAPSPQGKKTQLLVPPEALSRIRDLASVMGVSVEHVLRLTLEAKRDDTVSTDNEMQDVLTRHLEMQPLKGTMQEKQP